MVDTIQNNTILPAIDIHYVIDGGSLLHRVIWPEGYTYDTICDLYIKYVKQKYGNATIVFDGYQDGPSTKDAAHQRRTTGKNARQVKFEKEMICKFKKADFLANPVNKQRFLNLLSNKFEISGCITHHSKGDADTLIVSTAVQSATLINTILVGDDTDLLVLLLFLVKQGPFQVFFQPEPKNNAKRSKVWNINEVKLILGQNVCDSLPFLHAITGCDTSSRLFGVGKGIALKHMTDKLYKQAQIFSRVATKEEIISAGETSLVILYSGKEDQPLDKLRYNIFCEKVAKSTSFVQPHTLPPTSAAAKYHSFRVYLQCQEWLGSVPLNPT